MRILVTGGCGFIGSNFINYLFSKNDTIFLVNLDALYYSGKIENINKEILNNENYVFVKDNLQDHKFLISIFNKYNIEYVIHFAAQSHVQNSFEDSLQYTQDNILGTHNLLEASRKYNKLKLKNY